MVKFRINGVAFTFFNGKQIPGNVWFDSDEIGDIWDIRKLDGYEEKTVEVAKSVVQEEEKIVVEPEKVPSVKIVIPDKKVKKK